MNFSESVCIRRSLVHSQRVPFSYTCCLWLSRDISQHLHNPKCVGLLMHVAHIGCTHMRNICTPCRNASLEGLMFVQLFKAITDLWKPLATVLRHTNPDLIRTTRFSKNCFYNILPSPSRSQSGYFLSGSMTNICITVSLSCWLNVPPIFPTLIRYPEWETYNILAGTCLELL